MLITDDPEVGQFWSYALSLQGIEAILVIPTHDTTDPRSEQNYDLIIIDLYASRINAVNLIRHLRTEATVPILLLMSGDDEAAALAAYEAGVDECIIKPVSPRLFLAKVKAWMRRSWTVPAAMLNSFQVGDLRLEPAQRQLLKADGAAIKLTSLEFRLLHLLMSHPGQVLESSVIIDRVWGQAGGDNTLLKNVVYRLRRKIEPDPGQPRYIQSVAGEGYMFRA